MPQANPRAVIGDNSRAAGEGEPQAPAARTVSMDRVRRIELAARMLKALFRVPAKRIMAKRTGADDGRALRQFLIVYARGIGSPAWESARIFGLDAKQIGQEESHYLDMMAAHPDIDADAERMTSILDDAARVDTGRYLRASMAEIRADAACRRAVKNARAATKTLQAQAPPPPPLPLTEAERIVAAGVAKRRAAAIATELAIHMAVIWRAAEPGANREALADAVAAVKAMDALTKERRKLAPTKPAPIKTKA